MTEGGHPTLTLIVLHLFVQVYLNVWMEGIMSVVQYFIFMKPHNPYKLLDSTMSFGEE